MTPEDVVRRMWDAISVELRASTASLSSRAQIRKPNVG